MAFFNILERRFVDIESDFELDFFISSPILLYIPLIRLLELLDVPRIILLHLPNGLLIVLA